jgi:hypothetical protein
VIFKLENSDQKAATNEESETIMGKLKVLHQLNELDKHKKMENILT